VGDVRRALEESPDPFASDPEAKKVGMAHFQPDALTISRGDLWRERRDFAEAVLGAAPPPPEFVLDDDTLDFSVFHREFQRLTRCFVLGADDPEVTELLGTLMDQANGRPSSRSEEFDRFEGLIEGYVAEGAEGSLVGVAASVAATDAVRASRQFTHWLFAMGDTLAVNVWRALGLLAAYPAETDLTGTLLEAMRLWPTTPMLSRVTLSDLEWHGAEVEAGTQVLIVNTFMHRDEQRLGDAAHRFTPKGWSRGGQFVDDWGINFFSHGPQACPGGDLSVQLGVAAMQAVLERGRPVFDGTPALQTGAELPHMLDPFALRLALS
jgi:hypothetical protein